jgi:hypothetical protein
MRYLPTLIPALLGAALGSCGTFVSARIFGNWDQGFAVWAALQAAFGLLCCVVICGNSIARERLRGR